MLEFQLFRIKVYPPKQPKLFQQFKSPQEILKEVIASLPSAELRKDKIWHIGNLSYIDDNGLYFRCGRTTKSTMEFYKDGNFIDTEFEVAPYTHVILDNLLEICAIAKKTKLASRIPDISKQLVRLLNESEYNKKHFQARFEISEINDPEDFIVYIRRAYIVSKFWITFSKPNPWDVNSDFYKPMERLLDETGGEKGKTELIGQNLQTDKLEDLARTAASTGNEAVAWLQLEKNAPKVKKQLKGNPVSLSYEDVADEEQRKGLLIKIRELYERIKGNG
jgi:acyl-CoA synthetase (AMP-forming)/AMP-acid ligase II